MKKVSADKYVDGVNSIYVEQPEYKLGHDGSDGYCDCIGMGRGGLIRAGATNVTNMRGTNQAARKTLLNLRPVVVSELRKGDVLLKTRDMDDPDMRLPDSYRPGGTNYNGDLTNYTHYGTVTRVNPLEITHMTSPKPKKDTKIGNWKIMCQLPWVDYDSASEDETDQDPVTPEPEKFIFAEVSSNGNGPVNTRTGPGKTYPQSKAGKLAEGTIVEILKTQGDWSYIETTDKRGATWYCWMASEFLIPLGDDVPDVPEDPVPEEPDIPEEPDEITITLTMSVEEARHVLAVLDQLADAIASEIGRG